MVYKDRIKQRAALFGSDIYLLGDAITGFHPFSTLDDGSECYYYAEGGGGVWEVGQGVFSLPNVLTRVRVTDSSTGGAINSMSSCLVTLTVPAEAVEQFARGVSVTTVGQLRVGIGTVRWYPHTGMIFSRWMAWVGEAPDSDITFTLRKNGVIVANGTITASSNTMSLEEVFIYVGVSDYLTLDVTSVGSPTTGADLTVRLLP